MPPRSKVETLPPELKAWLDAEMVRRGFGDYVQLAADLQERGASLGVAATPSKSALHRYGSVYELRMAQLKSSVEVANALVDAVPDDEDKMGSALLRMAQEKLLHLMMHCDIDPDDVDVNKLFKSVAEVSKASSVNKKTRLDVRERMAAALAKVEKESQGDGKMTAIDALKRVREECYGIYKE